MKTKKLHTPNEARSRLVGLGGQMAQDMGFGRLAGQLLVYLYLQDGPRAMDHIEKDLGLSKAAVSTTARQLEQLGLLKRSYKVGDRRLYFRTADNLGEVLGDGFIAQIQRKVDEASKILRETVATVQAEAGDDADMAFLVSRIQRAKQLSDRTNKFINSRLLRFFAR